MYYLETNYTDGWTEVFSGLELYAVLARYEEESKRYPAKLFRVTCILVQNYV